MRRHRHRHLLPERHQHSLLMGSTRTRCRLRPRASLLRPVSHRMQVCAISASDANTTPSWIRLVCSAMYFTFHWCRSNRPVPLRRSFLRLRCQLMINFRNRFTSKLLFPCHCVSETLFKSILVIARVLAPSHSAPVRSPSRTCHGLCGGVATVLSLDATRTIDLFGTRLRGQYRPMLQQTTSSSALVQPSFSHTFFPRGPSLEHGTLVTHVFHWFSCEISHGFLRATLSVIAILCVR